MWRVRGGIPSIHLIMKPVTGCKYLNPLVGAKRPRGRFAIAAVHKHRQGIEKPAAPCQLRGSIRFDLGLPVTATVPYRALRLGCYNCSGWRASAVPPPAPTAIMIMMHGTVFPNPDRLTGVEATPLTPFDWYRRTFVGMCSAWTRKERLRRPGSMNSPYIPSRAVAANFSLPERENWTAPWCFPLRVALLELYNTIF